MYAIFGGVLFGSCLYLNEYYRILDTQNPNIQLFGDYKCPVFKWLANNVKSGLVFKSSMSPDRFIDKQDFYPPASEVSREAANLTERKNPHTPVYGVKEFVCNKF